MKEMSFGQHLQELRSTLVRMLLILLGGFIAAYSFSEQISQFLLGPLRAALHEQGQGQIIYLGLLDKMLTQFEVAFYAGLILSSPLWFWEVWRFIRPGMHQEEVKLVRPFLLSGLVLFWLGVAFGHFVVFPMTFSTIMSFGLNDVTAAIDLKNHLNLSIKVLFFLGLIFQLPNVMVILSLVGVINKTLLREKRRYVLVILAIAAAIFTPPDVVSMMGLWIPLCVLYEIGILAVSVFGPAPSKELVSTNSP